MHVLCTYVRNWPNMPRNHWTLAWMTATDSEWEKGCVFFLFCVIDCCQQQRSPISASDELCWAALLCVECRQASTRQSPVSISGPGSGSGSGSHTPTPVQSPGLCCSSCSPSVSLSWPQYGWGRGVHGGTIMNQYYHILNNLLKWF